MEDFNDLPAWCETFNFWNHSPTGRNRPDHLEFFEKAVARPAKIFSPPTAPMVGGTEAESHAKLVVIDGVDPTESFRHSLSILQDHEPADEQDAEKLRIMLDEEYASDVIEGRTGTVFELTLEHMVLGLREATQGENKVEDGPWCSLNLPNLVLNIDGQIDVQTRGVGELKSQWPYVKANSKRGWTVNSLPARPKPDHVSQVAPYWAWMSQQSANVPVTLLYANCKGYRVFSSQDCDELSPARLSDEMDRHAIVCKTRENLMSKCASVAERMSLTAPDFTHWMWKSKSPEYRALAEKTWSSL